MTRPAALSSLRLLACGLLAAMTLGALPASADDTRAEKVDRATRLGFGLAKRAKYPEAIKAFREALALAAYPDASLFYNLGKLNEDGLKNCGAALLYYQGYVVGYADGELIGEVQSRLARCRSNVLSTLGRLTIMSKYGGVPLRVDGVPLGSAPLNGVELPAGTYTITTDSDDYLPTTNTITVDIGLEARLELPLKRRMFKGILTVEVDPPDATIYVDEEVVAEKSPYMRKDAPTKTYLVRVEKPNWDRWVRYVTVERDSESKVDVRLEQTGEQVPIPPLPRND